MENSDTEVKSESSGYYFGYRKLILSLFAIVLIFVGIMSGHIDGATGSWAIVTVVSVAITGYAGEYLLKGKGTNGLSK
jgi:low affinity Fe/Cu permease